MTLFATITLINVILFTAKSILTVKSSREVASLVNAISYGLKNKLVENKLGFNEYNVNTKYGEQTVLDIFSQDRNSSKKIKEILSENGKMKYHVSEIGKQL